MADEAATARETRLGLLVAVTPEAEAEGNMSRDTNPEERACQEIEYRKFVIQEPLF